jgi:hypothetical protein
MRIAGLEWMVGRLTPELEWQKKPPACCMAACAEARGGHEPDRRLSGQAGLSSARLSTQQLLRLRQGTREAGAA